MAREPDSAHSATSQFFINLKENAAFNHQHAKDDAAYGYCVFGEVVAGLDVADRIAKSPTQPLGGFAAVPQPQVVIQEVTVE
jgi:cyclophilin family peptidyl-prolyl cis-trans isomerase